MTLVYRAMWSDDGPDVVGNALGHFRAWIDRRSRGRIEVPDHGTVVVPRQPDSGFGWSDVEVRVERSADGPTDGITDVLEAALVEAQDDGSHRTTTLRAWSGPACADRDDPLGSGDAWLWVDVESATPDPVRHADVRAPLLVRELLRCGHRPRRQALPLSDQPRPVDRAQDAEVLAELITGDTRDLPVVVFTAPPGTVPGPLWPPEDGAAARTARGVAGMAAVYVLAGDAVDALEGALTRPYAARDGAMRIYLPGVDPALDDDWRHRLVAPERFAGAPDVAVRVVVGEVATLAVSRRADDSHTAARAELRRFAAEGPDPDGAVLRSLLEEENARLIMQVAEARDQVKEIQSRYDGLLDDHQDLQADHASLQRRLERVLGQLRTLGHAGADAPEHAAYASQAVEQAREYLSDHLVIPPDAVVEIDVLDSAREAGTWGQSIWKGFQALHAYGAALADGRFDGSFWIWCQSSGDPRAWPATSKKLAMTESESVRSNARMRGARLLPVSPKVDPSGRIEMLAHLKIAEGGGNTIPRVYFHVSTDDGLVHVGFVGPHKYVPNRRTS